ncbi:uncharacterized protein [Henckelia pumila]|uniref:uncharacterized protein n=1 Tax=Henckelia pumila TaxID=405737 RepID=UPI003C6E3F54
MAKNRPIDTKGKKGFKVLVLNEVDKLSREAQHSLRRTMEKYSASCRLILCCNSSSKVTEAVRSRYLIMRINAPTEGEVGQQSNRSLRRAILLFETCRVQQNTDCVLARKQYFILKLAYQSLRELVPGRNRKGIADPILKGGLVFEKDPWSKVSEDAKNLVKGVLEPNPYSQLAVEEVFENRWIQNVDKVSNIPPGEHVKTRIKQFSLMNKFKKRVLQAIAADGGFREVILQFRLHFEAESCGGWLFGRLSRSVRQKAGFSVF